MSRLSFNLVKAQFFPMLYCVLLSKLICLLNNHNPGSASNCLDALDYHPGWTRKTYSSDEVFIGCLELPFKAQDDFWLETEDHVLAIDGEILSWSGPIRKESQTISLLQLFIRLKEDSVRYINGNFTLLVWEKKSKTLFVLNDRMGLRPFYFAAYQGKICLASEVKAILRDPDFQKRINTTALVDLFTYEYVLGNDTMVEGIEVFPYASTAKIRFGDARINPRQYWDFEYSADIDTPSGEVSEDYLRNFRDLLTQAVERTTEGHYRTGLFLSGGLDSRMIAGPLGGKKSKKIWSFTFGERNSDDVNISRRISKAIGSTHRCTGVKHSRLAEFFQKAVFYQDGLVSCNHCHYFHMLEEAAQTIQVGLDGFVGDVFPRQMFRLSLGKGTEEVYSVFSHLTEETRLRILDKSLEPEIRQSPERFNSLWEESLAKSPVNPLDHFNIIHRQRKFINYGKISIRNCIEIRTPFTDYDVVEFCLKMPRNLRIKDRIVKTTFLKFYPDLAKIPQSEAGYFTPGGFVDGLYRRIDALKSRLKTKGPLMDYARYYRSFLKSFVCEILLTPEFRSRGYFNYEEVEKTLMDHFQGGADHQRLIGVLLTFELWCRFFAGPVSSRPKV